MSTLKVNVKKNPEITVRLVRTLMQAIQIFKTNKEASMAVMRKYLRGANDDILAEAYDYFSAKIQKTPYPSADETVSESAFRKQSEKQMLRSRSA